MKLQDERITLETAKLAKEKGYHVAGYGSYTEYLVNRKDPEYPEGGGPFSMKKGEVEFANDYFMNNHPSTDYSNKNYVMYAAPTQALLARWLREAHGIQVYVVSGTLDGNHKYRDYVAHVCVGKSHDNTVGRVVRSAVNDARDEEYQTYEAAFEFGLQEALKNI
jgi:hypothetical protein